MTADLQSALAGLGCAKVTADHLQRLVNCCLRTRTAVITSVTVTPVDYPYASIATGALLRCSGTAVADGQERHWSIFLKQLQSARVWPLLHTIPESNRAGMVEGFPWRVEIDAYRSRLPDLLPAGLRLPVIYDIVELDDDRAAIWMEDVDSSERAWSLQQFGHAARLLGVLAGRRPLGTDVLFGVPPENLTPGFGLRMLVFGQVKMGVGAMLDDDALWAHPALLAALSATDEPGLRDGLRASIRNVDRWLDALGALPQTYVHGDASPQNLLVPIDDPDSFVVIDFGFNSPQSVGFDLGQLLIGLAHAGLLDPAGLHEVQQVILAAYIDGLRSTGFDATCEHVEQGFILSLLVRSLFTAVPLEQLHQPDSPRLRTLLTCRIHLARYLLNLAAERGGPAVAAAARQPTTIGTQG